MNRKQLLSTWVVIFCAMILAIVLIITSIMWLPAFLLDPELAKPIHEQITKRFVREVSKSIFRSNKVPTKVGKG